MIVAKLMIGVGLLAASHHGWADYDTKRAFTLEGTIGKVEYVNPHVLVHVQPADDSTRTWLAVLAPPSRMTRRGLPADSVRVGDTARLYGYPHKEIPDEMRAERITSGPARPSSADVRGRVTGRGWLEALEDSPLGSAMRDSLWLYPAAETIHLLGLATLVGCAGAFDLRLLGISRHLPARATARHLLACARAGFGVAAVSGLLLFSADATAIAANPAFRWKLALIAVAGVNALRFHLGPFRTAGDWDRGSPTPLPASIAAAVSLVVWVGAVTAGRLIAYV